MRTIPPILCLESDVLYAHPEIVARIVIVIQSIKMINYLVFDFFFHLQKRYIPTLNRIYTPMNIYIGFTLSPKRYAMRRLKPVLNYFSSLIIIMIVPPAPNTIQNIPPILLIVFSRLNICHPVNTMNKNKSIMPYLSMN